MHEVKVNVSSYVTGAAVNPKRFVKIGAADRTVIEAAAATDIIVGVSEDDANPYASGATIQVVDEGIARVEAGAAVTRGVFVTSDATGRAVNAVATNRYGGVALEAAAGAGVIISVRLGTGGAV